MSSGPSTVEVKALRLSALGSLVSSGLWDYSKCQPLHQWGRAAYIECAALHNGPVDRGGIVMNKCLRYR